jgi:hypothetical protein
MLHSKDDHARDDSPPGRSIAASYKTPLMLVCLAVAAIVGYYLWIYHSQHVLAVLPFLFFLACPLMHLLMHRKHVHEHQPQPAQSKNRGRHQAG